MSATVHTVRPRAILLDLDDTIIDFGSSAEPAWRAVCLARYFDGILIEGEFGYGKPEERVYRAAMETLHSPPGNTWYIASSTR